MQIVLALVVGVLITFVFAVFPAFSQTQNKVLEWSKSPIGSNNERTAPSLLLYRQITNVEIEEFAVGGKSITMGQPFAAADDWLSTITFRIKNISTQRLQRIQITVVLPQVKPGSPDLVFCYGCAPAQKEKGIMPGEVVELKMPGGEFYDWVKSRIEEKGLKISEINKAEISHMYVTPPTGPVFYSGCVKTTKPQDACSSGEP